MVFFFFLTKIVRVWRLEEQQRKNDRKTYENEFSFCNRYRIFSITHGDCQLAASVTVIFPQHDQIYALTLRQMRKNANRLFWVFETDASTLGWRRKFRKKRYGLEFYCQNRPKRIHPPLAKTDFSPNEPRNFLANVHCIAFYCNEKQMPLHSATQTVPSFCLIGQVKLCSTRLVLRRPTIWPERCWYCRFKAQPKPLNRRINIHATGCWFALKKERRLAHGSISYEDCGGKRTRCLACMDRKRAVFHTWIKKK